MNPSQLCRCCLSRNCSKDISSEYYHEGQKEVYSDMIFDTFSLTISYLEDSESRLICEDCINKLRNAAQFRRQAEDAEEAISKMISFVDSELLWKPETTDQIDSIDYDFIDHVSEDAYKWQIEHGPKEKVVEESKLIELQSDEVKSSKNKSNTKNNFNNLKLKKETIFKLGPDKKVLRTDKNILGPDKNILRTHENILRTDKSKKTVKKTKCKVKPNANDDNVDGNCMDSNSLKCFIEENEPKEKLKEKDSKTTNELKPQKHRKQNSIKLINNSNICLFDSLKTKFKCFYCQNSYLTINELREHGLTHSIFNLKYINKRFQGMSFKNADISKLSCKICSIELTDLTILQSHLTEQHSIEFNGSEHMFIPYRLESGFQCVICNTNFNTYLRLSIHMNSHYKNQVCEICGVSYISRLSLRVHVQTQHREKKCTICDMTFAKTYSRTKHMRTVHNRSDPKRYCLQCDQTFKYTYMLEEHRVREHGKAKEESVCESCGKSFSSAANLKVHTRSVHLKERNYPCQFCGMRFFTSCDQRRHERAHQDVRSFACDYCEGRFKAKDSLRRHLKRQHTNIYGNDVIEKER